MNSTVLTNLVSYENKNVDEVDKMKKKALNDWVRYQKIDKKVSNDWVRYEKKFIQNDFKTRVENIPYKFHHPLTHEIIPDDQLHHKVQLLQNKLTKEIPFSQYAILTSPGYLRHHHNLEHELDDATINELKDFFCFVIYSSGKNASPNSSHFRYYQNYGIPYIHKEKTVRLMDMVGYQKPAMITPITANSVIDMLKNWYQDSIKDLSKNEVQNQNFVNNSNKKEKEDLDMKNIIEEIEKLTLDMEMVEEEEYQQAGKLSTKLELEEDGDYRQLARNFNMKLEEEQKDYRSHLPTNFDMKLEEQKDDGQQPRNFDTITVKSEYDDHFFKKFEREQKKVNPTINYEPLLNNIKNQQETPNHDAHYKSVKKEETTNFYSVTKEVSDHEQLVKSKLPSAMELTHKYIFDASNNWVGYQPGAEVNKMLVSMLTFMSRNQGFLSIEDFKTKNSLSKKAVKENIQMYNTCLNCLRYLGLITFKMVNNKYKWTKEFRPIIIDDNDTLKLYEMITGYNRETSIKFSELLLNVQDSTLLSYLLSIMTHLKLLKCIVVSENKRYDAIYYRISATDDHNYLMEGLEYTIKTGRSNVIHKTQFIRKSEYGLEKKNEEKIILDNQKKTDELLMRLNRGEKIEQDEIDKIINHNYSLSTNQRRSNESGKKVVSMMGDGNCLFRSFSYQLYGTEIYHQMIREYCVEYMRQEKEYFKQVITDDQTFEQYLNKMNKSGTYGDNVEIQAMAEIYNRKVILYKPNKFRLIDPIYVTTLYQECVSNLEPIQLLYDDRLKHYDSVINSNSIKGAAFLSSTIGTLENEILEISKKKRYSNMNSIQLERQKFEVQYKVSLERSRKEEEERHKALKMNQNSGQYVASTNPLLKGLNQDDINFVTMIIKKEQGDENNSKDANLIHIKEEYIHPKENIIREEEYKMYSDTPYKTTTNMGIKKDYNTKPDKKEPHLTNSVPEKPASKLRSAKKSSK